METRWLYTTSENLDALREASKDTCVIPMGCVEKHGLHLPLGTDILEASNIAYLASQLETVTVFADYIFGDVNYQPGTAPAGTICIDIKLQMEFLEALCEQIASHGYKKILVLNGHGGNNPWLSTFSRSLVNKKRSFVFATYMMGLPSPHTLAEYLEKNGSGSIPELNKDDEALLLKYHEENITIGHGGMGETSFMMGICPESVHLERLGIESGLSQNKTKYLSNAGVRINNGGWDVDFPNDYCGHDPVGCNERIGKAALRFESERLANAIKVFKNDQNVLEWYNVL